MRTATAALLLLLAAAAASAQSINPYAASSGGGITGDPSGSAGGDLAGSYPNPVVAKSTNGSGFTVPGGVFSVGASTFQVTGGAIYPGISISTQAAGGAGALVSVSCPSKSFALTGGCSCTGGVSVTGWVNMPFPTLTAAGSMPTGWQCQEPGGTGGACAAFVLCSLMRF